MKVAIVLPWGIEHIGGVNEVVRNLLLEYKKSSEIDPVLIVSDWTGDWDDTESWEGIEVRRLRFRPPPAGEGNLFNFILAALHYPYFLYTLNRILKRERFEVVNAHYVTLEWFAFVVLRKLRLFRGRVVLSFHGTDAVFMEQSTGISRAIWQRMISNADDVVGCSNNLANRLREFVGNRRCPAVVIFNGVRCHDSDLTVAANTDNEEPQRIVAVGKYLKLKGHDILLSAFGNLAKDYPRVTLTFIGANGEHFDELARQASTLINSDNVSFIRDIAQHEVMHQMRESDLFVSASLSEGFPLVLLEAGLAKLAVVSTNVGGVPDMINHGESGLLVPPNDSVALENAIRKMLETPQWTRELAQRHHDRVVTEFLWPKAAGSYIEVFKSCTVEA